MRNLGVKFILILLLFFGCWVLFSQIDWMNILNIKEVSEKTEKKLGDLYWKHFKKSQNEITEATVFKPVDSLLIVLCEANGIDRQEIKLHILKNKEVNAFALPGMQIILLSGLITECKNEAELAGVIGHELAHIQEKHVMKKLIKEVGLSVLVSTATGGNSDVIRQSAKLLSSSAYDRSLEKAADRKAVDYLSKAEIPLKPMAEFLTRLAEENGDTPESLVWISTHPDTKARVDFINERIESKPTSERTILADSTWITLQDVLRTKK